MPSSKTWLLAVPSQNRSLTSRYGFRKGSTCSLEVQFLNGSFIACVASVSVWFESKKRPWKRIFGFNRARNETRKKKNEKPSFLPHPLPAPLLAPFFARSLTLVPHSLLLNRTETLATQARSFTKGVPFPSKIVYMWTWLNS